MAVQRSNRGALVRVALVGYTNVGKSTLMNLISKSEVFAENKLFATLDTTVRKVVFDNLPFLLSDTVGFIRKLPHGAHRVVQVDARRGARGRPAGARGRHLAPAVRGSRSPWSGRPLQEIGAGDKPVYLVFNKVDAYTWVEKDPDDLTPPDAREPHARRAEAELDRPREHPPASSSRH